VQAQHAFGYQIPAITPATTISVLPSRCMRPNCANAMARQGADLGSAYSNCAALMATRPRPSTHAPCSCISTEFSRRNQSLSVEHTAACKHMYTLSVSCDLTISGKRASEDARNAQSSGKRVCAMTYRVARRRRLAVWTRTC